MIFRRQILFLSFLLACVQPDEPTSDDLEAIRRVQISWEATTAVELPSVDRCIKYMRVRRYDDMAQYIDACLELRPAYYRERLEKSAGCVTTDILGVTGRSYYNIEIAPGFWEDTQLVEHECIHAFLLCTNYRSSLDPADWQHSDPVLWIAASKDKKIRAQSVQYRARTN